jgi:hypothetical protein
MPGPWHNSGKTNIPAPTVFDVIKSDVQKTGMKKSCKKESLFVSRLLLVLLLAVIIVVVVVVVAVAVAVVVADDDVDFVVGKEVSLDFGFMEDSIRRRDDDDDDDNERYRFLTFDDDKEVNA